MTRRQSKPNRIKKTIRRKNRKTAELGLATAWLTLRRHGLYGGGGGRKKQIYLVII